MKRVVLAMLIGAVAMSASSKAYALTEFKKEFQIKYLDSHKDDAFKTMAKKQSCKVCHVDKKKKAVENLNEYGRHLSKLVEGNANQRKKDARKSGGREAEAAEKEKLIKEIRKAFDEVAKMKSEEGDLFGDRIKNSKLPSTTDNPKDEDETDSK